MQSYVRRTIVKEEKSIREPFLRAFFNTHTLSNKQIAKLGEEMNMRLARGDTLDICLDLNLFSDLAVINRVLPYLKYAEGIGINEVQLDKLCTLGKEIQEIVQTYCAAVLEGKEIKKCLDYK